MNRESHTREEPSLIIARAIVRLQDDVAMAITNARQRLMQGVVVFSFIALLLSLATFLYGSFYYSYMPTPAFSTQVHFQYRTGCEDPTSYLCSYPVANISLMKNKKHVLTFGQAYQMTLQLEMPDSQVNRELGMFMIHTSCISRSGEKVASSARSARQLLSASSSRFSMLRYRSDLLRHMRTVLFLPAFLSGVTEEKQVLEVELFSDYTEDAYSPSASAFIEIQSSKVQIYSSQLLIHAHFTGIRYLLFNFPLFSALVGVTTNFFFLSLLFLFSYVRLLLRVGPRQLRPVGLLPERENNVSGNCREERDAATAGTSEVLGPLQGTMTNLGHRAPTLTTRRQCSTYTHT